MNTLRTAAVSLTFAAALALGACGKGEGDAAAPTVSGEALPKVAAPAGTAWSDTITETADGGYLMGNPNAPIKLVEYASLSCPHCAKFSQLGADKLENDYVDSGRVSWELRSFAIHPQDIPLTLLAQCAGKDTFFPLTHQIFTNFDAMNAVFNDKAALERAQAASALPPQQRFGAISQALGYIDFFAQRGVSADQARACLADGAKAQRIASLSEQYGADGIDSTPTLLVNGTKVEPSEWTAVEAALQKAGAR